MLPEQKKKPRKHRVFKALMAEAVGFEPTCPCGQLHFECSSLQPLRYASVYKYSLLGTNHMISSLVRTWYFRVCCGRWRQFWKRRKSLCCNGFWTHRPVLTSSISEKTRVQIEMRNVPKRSIFLRAGKKTCKKKTLVRYVFADRPPD